MLIGRHITIIGAGIAGLALGRALALRGASVAVHEQAEALTEVGAGIQIAPNGHRVLAALGLDAAVQAVSGPSESVTLRDHRAGRLVVRLNMAGRGAFRLMHRADLIEILGKGLLEAGGVLHLGQRIEDLEDLRGDLVVGADGVRSIVRGHVLGASEPFFTGQTAWRALVPVEKGTLADGAQVFMAPGRHVVIYPLRNGTIANIVAVAEQGAWKEEGWFHAADPVALRQEFAEFGGVVRGLLARVEEVHRWGLFRHPVAPHWSKGRYAVIGDAAHPTLPFLAQGANLALEDSFALAAALDADWESALAWLDALRIPRVTRVVAAASANARNYHLGGVPRLVAHTGLRMVGRVAPRRLVDRFDWLYGYDVTTEI